MINSPTKVMKVIFKHSYPFLIMELLDYDNDIFHDNYILKLKFDYMSTL
jgi:hypothetical protein